MRFRVDADFMIGGVSYCTVLYIDLCQPGEIL